MNHWIQQLCLCYTLSGTSAKEIKYIDIVQTEQIFFFNNIPTLITWKFVVFFANTTPLNKVLKHKDSALQINWILTKKIGRIIQCSSCLLSYLKSLCYIMLHDHNNHKNPFISTSVLFLVLQQPVHFWLHVLLDHQNPKATYCREFCAMKWWWWCEWMADAVSNPVDVSKLEHMLLKL